VSIIHTAASNLKQHKFKLNPTPTLKTVKHKTIKTNSIADAPLWVTTIIYLLEYEDKLLIVHSLQLPPLIQEMLAQHKTDSLKPQEVEEMLVMKVSMIYPVSYFQNVSYCRK
jgi:hypothetical protein